MSTRNRPRLVLLAMVLVSLTTAAAGAETKMPSPMRGTAETQPPAAAPAPAPTQWVRGKVLETMDAGNYTYVHVDTGGEKKWAAGPKTEVKVGDQVAFPGGAMEMKNFESKSLGRKFESIAFVGTLVVGEPPAAGKPAAADPHAGIPGMGAGAKGDPHAGVPGMGGAKGDPHAGAAPKADPHAAASGKKEAEIEVKDVAKAKDGYTVGEIYDKRGDLEAKEVRIRGKVVKYNAGVMGKNWIHLRDGSTGKAGENDLTVTTSEQATVGDTVTVQGRLGIDRDFGFGYRYDVIVEDATVDDEE